MLMTPCMLRTFCKALIREDAANTYYTDQDPFDYIYSVGTQYSDALYKAVVQSDHSLTPEEISEYYIATNIAEEDPMKPPPLSPRNLNKSNQSESGDDFNGVCTRVLRICRSLIAT